MPTPVYDWTYSTNTSNTVLYTPTTLTDTVWTVWVDTGTSTTISNQVWQGWQNVTNITVGTAPYVYPAPRQLTAEELAAQQAVAEEARARWAEESARRQAVEAEARRRARILLEENLSADQRAQLHDNDWFEVVTPKGTYRIHNGRSGNVTRFRDGRATDRYCIHPTELVPNEDTMLAQKLLLDHDEDAFLRIANRSQPWV